MAVYKRDIVDIELENGNIHRSFLNRSIGMKDQKADHFGIRVFRNGEAVNLSGVAVQGVFMPPQGSPIAITSGNIVSGNTAEVVLPQACYNYDGVFTLAIKLVDSSNSVTGTMRIVDGMVDNTHASGTVAPTGTVPTYQEVLAVYDDAIAAIQDVNDLKSALSNNQYAVQKYIIPENGSQWPSNDPILLNIKAGEKYRFYLKQTASTNRTFRYYINFADGTNYTSGWLSGSYLNTISTASKDIVSFKLEAPSPAGGTAASEFIVYFIQEPFLDEFESFLTEDIISKVYLPIQDMRFDNNILTGQLLTKGKYFQTAAGADNDNYYYTDLISVESGHRYYVIASAPIFFALYDTNKSFISGNNTQYYFNTTSETKYVRISISKDHIDQTKVIDDGSYVVYGKDEKLFKIHNKEIIGTYMDSELTSLDDAKVNTCYIIHRTSETTITGFPSDYPTDGSAGFLYGYKANYQTNAVEIIQFLENGSKKWRRRKTTETVVFDQWERITNSDSNDVHIGIGYGFESLREGIEFANTIYGATVYVHAGTYDLITEFEDEIAAATGQIGIRLTNNIHVIFLDGAKVTANFINSNNQYTPEQWSWIYNNFQPFFSFSNDSFIIENLDIEATDTRYCVHDEHSGSGTYYHQYINCRMKYKSTHNPERFRQCIGGGLGLHGTIVIDGGYYEVENEYGTQQPITYHNGNNSECDSSITIKNVYLADEGYFRFGYYGPSIIKSHVLISGCSMGAATVVAPETSESVNQNFDLVEWNNTIR